MAEPAEHAAGAEGIADALIDAVFQRDMVVMAIRLEAADLDHHHDKVGVFDSFAPVGGGPYFGRHLVIADHSADERLHSPKLGFGRAHQRKFAVGQRRRREDIADKGFTEHHRTRADHCNLLGHVTSPLKGGGGSLPKARRFCSDFSGEGVQTTFAGPNRALPAFPTRGGIIASAPPVSRRGGGGGIRGRLAGRASLRGAGRAGCARRGWRLRN
jgi:hypothetical protein